MRVLISGGGTGGHCTPAVAVVEALCRIDPETVITYVGRSGGPESRLVPEAGIHFQGLSLGSMGSSPITAAPRLVTRLPLAYRQAGRLVDEFDPDVVLATGGYVCVPVAMAAFRRHLPVVLLEQNRHPGRAVRWLAPRARVVASSFRDTAAELPGRRVVHTGNPVRGQFVGRTAPDQGGIRQELLVMGGSQGARHLNQVLLSSLAELFRCLPHLHVTHLTGRREYQRVLAQAEELGVDRDPRYRAVAFADDVAALIAAAGMVLMRAGGSSLAEVACVGKPMVLVPYPHAGAHQLGNAEPYQEAGAAEVIPDQGLTEQGLVAAVRGILQDPERWARMSRAAAEMARPGAAEKVAGLLFELARGTG